MPYTIVHLSPSQLLPYPNNPRINDQAVPMVAASILEFGWRQPIVASADRVIVCGHTRWKAALLLEERGQLEGGTIPVHIAEGLTDAQLRAYRLVDNRTSELSDWDWESLRLEIETIGDEVDLSAFSIDSEWAADLDTGKTLSTEERLMDSAGAIIKVVVPVESEEEARSLIEKALKGIQGAVVK